MSTLPAPVALVPHKGDAVLLDEIRSIGERRLAAALVVRPGTAFSDDAGCLPGWIGPEIMAQAIAALSGQRSLAARGRPAAIGLLLGVRSYETSVPAFFPGDALAVEVIESSEDEEGRAVFDCPGRRVGNGHRVSNLKPTPRRPSGEPQDVGEGLLEYEHPAGSVAGQSSGRGCNTEP